jgi:hypothetical protein
MLATGRRMTHAHTSENIHLVAVGPVLTLADARALGSDLERRLAPLERDVVLDLSATSLAARPALVVALREIRAAMRRRRGRAVVVARQEHRDYLLGAARFDDVLLLAPSLEAAWELTGRTVPA